VFLASRGRNTISVLDSAYVTIANLLLDGRGLPVDGVKAEGRARWAHHITLEGLVIRGHGKKQQTVAISTKSPAWGWQIGGNIIEAAGTGMYLGNSNGSDAPWPVLFGYRHHCRNFGRLAKTPCRGHQWS